MHCVKCGKPLPEHSGPGRPRKYCGPGCRKASELEIERLNARIARAERDESRFRMNGADAWSERAAAEVRRLEARLAELLAAQQQESTTTENDHAD